jgi:hypothetical protein
MWIKLLYNIFIIHVFYKYITRNKHCIGPSYEPYQLEYFTFGIFVGLFLQQIKNRLY